METIPWTTFAPPIRPARQQATWWWCIEQWYELRAAYLKLELPQGWKRSILTQQLRAREMAALRRWRQRLDPTRHGTLTPEALRQMLVWFWLVKMPELLAVPCQGIAGLRYHWYEWLQFQAFHRPWIEADGIVKTCDVCLQNVNVPRQPEMMTALLQMLEARRV